MGKRNKPPPLWVQAFLVWFVLGTLLTFGVLYLRATDTLSDRVFQPLASILCASNDRLATSYELRAQESRRDFGDSRDRPQGPIWSLSAAECVGPSGDRRPAPGFQPLVWLTVSTAVGCLVLLSGLGRRRPNRKTTHSE
jgi:hypothetical protein